MDESEEAERTTRYTPLGGSSKETMKMLQKRRATERTRRSAQSGSLPNTAVFMSTTRQTRSQHPLPARNAKPKGAPKEVKRTQYLFQRSSSTMGQVTSRNSVNGYSMI